MEARISNGLLSINMSKLVNIKMQITVDDTVLTLVYLAFVLRTEVERVISFLFCRFLVNCK